MNDRNDTLFRICLEGEWEAAKSAGVYAGNELDRRDGFIHLSTREQLLGTAETHFSDRRDLVILCVQFAGSELAPRWERSRNGQLFPHLYADLPVELIVNAIALPNETERRAEAIASI